MAEPSSFSTLSTVAPECLLTSRGHPVASLMIDIDSDYLDHLITSADDEAEDLSGCDEDLQRERDCSPSPELEPPQSRQEPDLSSEGEEVGKVVLVEEPCEEEESVPVFGKQSKTEKRRMRAQRQEEGRVKRAREAKLKPPPNQGRRRRQQEAKKELRKQQGWCAQPQVRDRISRLVTAEPTLLDIQDQLIKGTQLGGYRPRVKKMEGEVKRMMERVGPAYSGRSNTPAEDVLADLKAMGYRMVAWDGVKPILLTDSKSRVFAALAGQPGDSSWRSRCMELHDIMVQEGGLVKQLPRRNHIHRRGHYSTIGAGVTFAPGDKRAHNLRLTEVESRLIYGSGRRWKLKMDIRKFAESCFDLFAPRLYRYYTSHMMKLRQHPAYTHLYHNNPYMQPIDPEPAGFASHAENQPPCTFTVPHRDMMNLSFGWCAIVALGRFDSEKGGHLVLHDLKLVIPFPHGSLILIPSAFLWHSNVPIQTADESRASITFFSSSGLFRFIDNDFQTEADYSSSLSKEDRELHLIEKKGRAKIGATFYSTLDEILHPETAELDPVML